MTIQCCRCNKIRVDGKWSPTHEGLHSVVTHTYCPVCLDIANAEIRAELAHFPSRRVQATARA